MIDQNANPGRADGAKRVPGSETDGADRTDTVSIVELPTTPNWDGGVAS